MRRRELIICVVAMALTSAAALSTRQPCRKLMAEYGYVCVCDDNYCDTLDVPEPKAKEYILVTSSESGDRFSYKKGKFTNPQSSPPMCLEINPSVEYQEIKGFGGAYTGAVTYLVDKLSPNLRNCLFNSYFSQRFGMGYTKIRLPIGGCDFDLRPWAYNEYPKNDPELTNFTKLDERDSIRNKQLKELVQVSGNKNVKYLAAAWSAPTWMKADKQWHGLPNNTLLEKYYQSWAEYHVKWLDLMDKDNMKMWAISTGNEPVSSKINYAFEQMYWNITLHAKWIAENFGPTIRQSKFSDIEIFGFDDNRLVVDDWLNGMKKGEPDAFDYLSAIQFHGYTDNITDPAILDDIQHNFTDKDIWYSEMTFGPKYENNLGGPRLGLWSRAEDLMNILFENFAHSTNGYIDWNIILNATGGPNNALGGIGVCDAPIILNKNNSVMYKQPMFYVFAHFSKFITPGSVRIDAQLWGDDDSVLQFLAFKRPDKKSVILVYNSSPSTINLHVTENAKKGIEIAVKPKSLNTLIYSLRDDNGDAEHPDSTNVFVIPSLWN